MDINQRYDLIDNALFKENRAKLCQQLKPGSVVIIKSDDIYPSSGDGTRTFVQNADLFYLTGVDQEETILVLFPDAPYAEWREILFLKRTSPEILVWEGYKLTEEQAQIVSGVKNIQWSDSFEMFFNRIMVEARHVYLYTNEHSRNSNITETANDRFIAECKKRYPLHQYERVAPILNKQRMKKSAIEAELIRKACNITAIGFNSLLKMVKPGVTEYEIEAELIYHFKRNRSKGFAYDPIIASGKNSCILHYNDNSRVCKDGDVLLLDIAAEYANYKSDLSRVLPVSGKFTKRQKEVYNAVLRVFKYAKSMLVTGNNIPDYEKAVGAAMEKELVDLGLITMDDIKNAPANKPAYKKYFMHGTSHLLGLVVHDNGYHWHSFEAGYVWTCEPGIYIPEEGIGIRLENDILITENGNEDLMANIAIEADEIEALMNS